MKCKYLRPETFQVELHGKIVMSANSPQRNVGGGPSEDEGFPTTVGETDGVIDPYSDNEGNGRGQGTGGGGNRAKGNDLWDWDW